MPGIATPPSPPLRGPLDADTLRTPFSRGTTAG